MAPAGASTWRLRALFGTPLTKSRLPGGSTNGPSGCVHMASPRQFRHTLKRLVPPGRSTHGPIGRVHTASLRQFRHTPSHVSCSPGRSTHGPIGRVHMAPPPPFRHTRRTFGAPQRTPPVAPAGAPTWRPRAHVAHHACFVPPRDLHLWPQRVRPHGVPAPMSAHPSHVSSPPGSFIDSEVTNLGTINKERRPLPFPNKSTKSEGMVESLSSGFPPRIAFAIRPRPLCRTTKERQPHPPPPLQHRTQKRSLRTTR